MLEVFGAFNFAVAGASNALVNLYQGETEEINPFVEAYRGFTLKDKEIFGDVLENLGWEGEDGFAYWSRESLGFVMDVVLDPINFIALGSPQAARLARGVATTVRLRGTSKIGSSTVKPVREFANITSKIVNKGLEGLERGDAFKLGSVDSNRRVQSFKEAARRNLDPQYEAGDINKAVLEAQESVARLNLEDGVRAEVDQVFAMMAIHNDPRTLRKLLEESRGGPDKLRALQAAIGGDMDGEISGEILRHFLSLENKDPNIENVIEFLTSRTGGIRNIIDPGGLQLRVPFTDKGVVIAEAQWLDDFALNVEEGIVKALGIASTFTPGPIKTGLSAVAKTIVSGAKKTSQAVGKAFGADARRSGVLHALLTNRAARLNTGMANATEETKQILTWNVAGKDEALPTEFYEPLVETILAEQDNAMKELESGKRFFDQRTAQAHIDRLREEGTPRSLRRAQEIEDSIPRTPDGQRSLLGYEEKHIPGMGPVGRRLRDEGTSDVAIEELERIARAVNDAFINQYDSAVKAGVEMQYMDYYLSVQYSGWAPPKAVQMAAGAEDATGRLTGKDPFAQRRFLTKSEADEMGLTASTDLYGLIYNRMFQGRRVQIERQFVSQLVEKLAVHPGQVGKVLRRMYGPASAEGQDLIQVLLNQSNYEELLTTENLGVLIPDLDDFRDLVQTGDFEGAQHWIEAKADLIPLLSTGEGRTQFFDAVQADIQAGLGTLTDYVDGITTADKGFLAAEQKLSNALGANAADIDRLLQDLGIVEEGAPAIGAAIRTIMQEKLRRILPDANLEGLTSIDVLKRTTGERDWIRLESAAPDTGKLVILMNALDDATPAGNRIKDQLLARVPGLEATLDDITEGLAETITEARRLVPDNTVVAARMEEQLLQMALSAIPGSALENFVRRSTILPRGINESQVYSKLQEVFDLELAGKSREAAALTEELVDQYARHPDLIEWYNDWRKSHGMPDDPSMPLLGDRIALQNRIISVMREAKEHTYKSGMEMFRKPVYAPGPQLPSGQKRLSALEKMKDKVRSELGSNSERFLNVLDLVRAPTTAMPGYHYSPLSATKSAVLKLYAQEGSSVLELITRTSARLEPSAVISRLGTEKAMFSGLTRSVVGQPTELMGLLKELNEGTTLRMAEALRRIPGADPEAAQRLVIDLESELSRLASARTGSDVILTQVHEETAAAFEQFALGLEKILPTEGGRTLMLGAINDMKNSLLESNRLSLDLYQKATKLSEKITRLVEDPAAILSANPDDILKITQEVVTLRDSAQEMMVKADKATRELLGPNNPHPAGWDEITETEHLSNVLLGNAEDLHRDMQSIFGESQELADAFQTSQLEIARGKRTDAAQALAAIDQELLPIEAQVNDIVTRVGYVRQAESLQTSAFRRLATLDQNFASGNGLSSLDQEDVLRTFLELGVADEFLRGKDYTPTGWAAAVERVGTKGPSQGTLKAWWREARDAGGINDAVLFQQLEEIATGQSLRPADAQLWAAQRRPPFLGGPTGEAIRDAARDAVNSVDPAFLDELGIVAPDLIARADATARNASAFRENTEQLIARMADGAFLPDQTLREMAESVHYERKFLEALVNEMTSQQGLVESLFGMRSPVGRRVLGRFRLDLEEVLIQQRGDLYRTQAGQLIDDVNSITAELLVLATADRQAALVRLGEIVGPGADVSHLIDSLSDAASQMSQLPTARQFRDLVSRIQTSVDDLYRPAVDLLDDQASARVLGREGVPQFFADNLAQHPNDPIAQALGMSDGVPARLQDGEFTALEQLIHDINGPTGASSQPFLLQLQNAATGAGGATSSPELSRRAQYWLYRIGQGYGGGAVGNAGMTIDQSNTLLERLGRYRGRNRAAEAVGFADDFLVKDKLPALRQSATTKYEARGVLSNEIAFLDEAIPRMETRTYTSNQLDYKPEQAESWRGMFAMQNYLELQVRRAEHLALNQVVQQLPSRDDLNYMLLRAQTGAFDASEETLDTLRNARLQGAGEGRGVLSPEHTIALEEVTAGRRVHIEEAGEFVFAHAGKKVRDLTGIDFQKLDIQYGTDVPVSQQFLAQVGIELEKLGPERFANMGGSEGSRLIQEVEGRLVVADSIEAAGVRTDANADFANGVAQVHDYLKLVETEGGTLSNVPALDLQKVQLNRALNWFFPGPVEAKTAEEVAERLAAREQKKLLLQAVVGHQNIDKLSSSEASAVLYYLQTNTSVDVTNLGRRAQKLMERADYNLMGLRERGLVPPHLERKYRQGKIDDAELLEEFQKLKLDPDDPELPVKLSFPGMANDIDPGWGIQGRPLGEAVFVPQWVQQAVKSAVSPEGEIGPVARGMLRVSDSFTNSFKWAMTLPWPAFHFRNVLDAAVRTTFAMGIKGLSPTWNRKVFEIMRANPSAKMTFGGVEYNAKTLLNMFEDLGGQVTFSEKIGKTAVNMDISDSRILSPFSSNFVIKGANSLADGASTIAGTGDNFFRLSVWLDGMDKGMGATGAMQHAQKFLFDYANGLSPFERSFMRRVFPFYTFSRFNVPLQLGLMFKRPGIISAMGKTHNLLSESRVDPIDELLPSYVREQWRFGPKIEDGQLKIWSGRNLLATEELGFLGDLATWRGKGTPEIFFDEIFARLNPMLKIPVELYMGHNLYFNTKIAEDQTIRGAVLDWPVVREFLQMRKVKVGSGEDARVLYRVNGNRFHLLNQLHFSRLYRSIVSIVGPEDGETWERFVPFITGLRLTSIDLGRRLQHLESVANFNQENIRKALSQGDWVAVERILFGTERQPYQQLQLVEQLKSLEQLTQITSK
jgi:hypothetical protein